MSRIRSVHPKICTDEAFVSLSFAARTFLMLLWTECDDQGSFQWKPVTLKMELLPADNVDIEELLAELVAANCIMRYMVCGKTYGAVRNFCKFQRPKKPNAIYPQSEEIKAYCCCGSSEPVGNEYGTGGEIAKQMEDGEKDIKGDTPLTPQGDVPDSLKEIWDDWITYRRERKLAAYKPTTVKKQVAFLLSQPNPRQVVDEAIRNNWHGLFPVGKASRPPLAERHAERLKRMGGTT